MHHMYMENCRFVARRLLPPYSWVKPVTIEAKCSEKIFPQAPDPFYTVRGNSFGAMETGVGNKWSFSPMFIFMFMDCRFLCAELSTLLGRKTCARGKKPGCD